MREERGTASRRIGFVIDTLGVLIGLLRTCALFWYPLLFLTFVIWEGGFLMFQR